MSITDLRIDRKAITRDSDLTVKEVAAMLRDRPQAVRVGVRRGYFPNAYRLPGRRAAWRIPRTDIQGLGGEEA
jgi:hypothetical protein